MVEYCEMCDEKDRLFEAITGEGVKLVCRRCLRMNNYPIIQKANAEQIRYEHLFSGYKEAKPISHEKKVKDKETEALENDLKKIVLEKISKKDYEDLVENFHWHIQHSRRMKKLSQKQLAEAIAEPEVIISMAEKGELPDDYEKIISKLEQYFKLRIRKNSKKVDGISDEGFNIRKADLTSVTIGDLKKAKESEEDEGDGIEIISFEEE